MEAVVKELRHDAQLGEFFAPDCNVSAIASAIVGRDAAVVTSKQMLSHTDSGSTNTHSNSNSTINATLDEADSHSERFILRIDDAVRKIDRVISDHIGDNHSALLDHVGSTDGLQTHVTAVQASVQHLLTATSDLESVVQAQHTQLATLIDKQRRVDKCSDIVRRLLRFHHLSERVLSSTLSVTTTANQQRTRSHSNSSSNDHVATNGHGHSSNTHHDVAHERVTLAHALREIDALVADPKFDELSLVRARLPRLQRIRAAMQRDVRAHLRSAMTHLSQSDVSDALEILWCLRDLRTSVQTIVNDVIQDVERLCAAAIAEDALLVVHTVANDGAGSTNTAVDATPQRADVWRAIQHVFDVVRVHALEVWTLERVLVQLKDASTVTTTRYIDLVLSADEPTLFATFWDVTSAILCELWRTTLAYRPAVQRLIVSSYPRMRDEATRVLDELAAATHLQTQQQQTTHRVRGIATTSAERNLLLNTMAPVLDAYTESAYRRLVTPIELMFPHSAAFHTSPPGRSDMQTLARTFVNVVDSVVTNRRDAVLIEAVLTQVARAIGVFATSVQRIATTGKAATAMAATLGRTPAQAHNVGLLHVLQQLESALDDVVARVCTRGNRNMHIDEDDSSTASTEALDALCARAFGPSRLKLQRLASTLLGTYLQALCVVLESVLAKMHDESFADVRVASMKATGSLSAQISSGSRYMREFQSVFQIVLDEHVKRLPNTVFAATSVQDFVARLIAVFLRHVALLRPLEEAGKLRLANDMAQFELLVANLLPLETLGSVYDELRAFRHVVFLDTAANILRDPMIDRMRPSNVWHHLIARAPVELELPHQKKRWTAAQYIDWLDTVAGVESRSDATDTTALLWPLAYPCLKDRRVALQAEQAAWREVVQCLDAYAQRVSATTADNKPISPIYDALLESGAILLAGYEVALTR